VQDGHLSGFITEIFSPDQLIIVGDPGVREYFEVSASAAAGRVGGIIIASDFRGIRTIDQVPFSGIILFLFKERFRFNGQYAVRFIEYHFIDVLLTVLFGTFTENKGG
jgi:hypothetical protein